MSPLRSDEPLRLVRGQIGLAAAIALVTLALGGLRAAPGVIGAYHDDGVYVATAKALADGSGYVQPFLPEPLPQTKYPVLLPAIFALIWKAAPQFPENAVLFQGFCLLSIALANGLAYLFLIRFRYAGPRSALVAAGLVASSPVFLYFGTLPLSEGPFALLAVAVFWAVEETLYARAWVPGYAAIAGIAVALAGSCRSIGFVWIGIAVPLFLLRQRRAIVPFLLFAALPMAAWIAWSFAVRPANVPPIFYWYVDYASWWSRASGWEVLNHLIQKNILWILESVSFTLLPGPAVVSSVAGAGTAWLACTVSLGVILRALPLAREGRALPWLVAIYFIPVVLWPWPPNRFVAPLAALAGGLFIAEAARIWRKRWPCRWRPALGVALGALVLNLALLIIVHHEVRTYQYPILLPRENTPRWPSLEQGFSWLRAHTPPNAIVAASLDPMVWLYTGRRSFRFYEPRPLALFYDQPGPKIEDPDRILANLHAQGASFLFDAPMHNHPGEVEVRERIRALARRRPSPIVRVFRSDDGTVQIYRVRHELGPPNDVEPGSSRPNNREPGAVAEGHDRVG